jgi:hypothetical protein
MILDIPSVTLLAIDCFTPEKTLRAMEFSARWVRFADVILLTDRRKFQLSSTDYIGRIKLIHHEEGDRKAIRQQAPWNPPLPADYELARMQMPAQVVTTPHYLAIEWDSAVLNPPAWRNEWLEYDYIGAPWPPHLEPGWPECDGETNAVGNGGFSLQSLRYARAIKEGTEIFAGDPGMISSDMWPCRTLRPWLEEKHGIRFAPPRVAWDFSCENRIYSGQFGFHGRWTAEMNGWGGDLFGNVRPK